MISRASRSASSLHRFLRGLLGGKARPFMTSSSARLLGLFQVSERLLQPIRRAIGHFRPVLTGYYTLSSLLLRIFRSAVISTTRHLRNGHDAADVTWPTAWCHRNGRQNFDIPHPTSQFERGL